MEAGKEGGGRLRRRGVCSLPTPGVTVLVSPSIRCLPSILTAPTHIAIISDTGKEAPKEEMIHQDPPGSPQWCQLTEAGPLKDLVLSLEYHGSQHTQKQRQGPEGSQGTLTRSGIVES